MSDEQEVPESVVSKVTDYVDGALSDADRDEVAAKIASDPLWKRAHDDVLEEQRIIIQVTDYVDGKLTGAARDEVAAIVESDPKWKSTHDEMVEARKVISGMRKPKPDQSTAAFVKNVTETINKRSQGRFFAPLPDRMFPILVIISILALAVVGYLMWSSPTGSLKVDKPKAAPEYRPLDLKP
jgi:anti-sigma factor RsiW